VIDPLDVTYYWLIPVAVIPALLGTILIFLDQQITSVIVNRKEHKLKVSLSCCNVNVGEYHHFPLLKV